MSKKRVDQLVQEQYPQLSRTLIQSYIIRGYVTINGTIITKPGVTVPAHAKATLAVREPKYVSRAGFKLEKALDHFGVDVKGFTVLDAGLSTGGFADCLLQRGAYRIYGVDVGYGQVHEKIRHDPRVVVMERVNLRSMSPLSEKVDLVTLDLSFISVLKVMDTVRAVLKEQRGFIVLIKPQFEAKKAAVKKGGLIKDPKIHERVVKEVVEGIEHHGFSCAIPIESPILGTTGNKEFLTYCKKF
jgi:23S rRNA (cytidine1920-2'-O)/16S rRNA (cytidine1409-2'-O)-methyltransferase